MGIVKDSWISKLAPVLDEPVTCRQSIDGSIDRDMRLFEDALADFGRLRIISIEGDEGGKTYEHEATEDDYHTSTRDSPSSSVPEYKYT